MNKHFTRELICGMILSLVLFTMLAHAAEPAPPAATALSAAVCDDDLPQREIYVPLADLHVILLSEVQRTFVTREEYETLAAQARAITRPAESTQPAAVLTADYVATIEENRARLLGTIVVAAPDDNWSAIELDLSGVAVRSATLDGKPAALGRNPAGLPVLFVRGAGRHELKLEILAMVETAAAERTLSFQIPTPPATRLRLTAPGHVEIKSGATVIRRKADDEQQVTEFDLLPRRGLNSLVLSLNNRQLQKERVLVAHAVAVDEITAAYERLHVTASVSVLHGATDRLRFAVPAGFEITSVSAPEVSRWAVTGEAAKKEGENNAQAAPAGRVLEVFLREPATGTVALGIVAARWPVPLDNWQLPKLDALDVAGQATVVGILLENRLKPSEFRPRGLIPIDASVLSQALPASALEDRSGAPPLVPVAAFYAPRTDYDLHARFAAPAAELRVTTNVLLSVSDEKLQAHGGFALLDETDKLVEFDFIAPAGWQVIEVRPDGGAPLPIETYPAAEGRERIHVRLPQAVAAGQSRNVYFRAVSWPKDWLDDWQNRSVEFPVFQVVGATHDVGAIAVQASDDLSVRADQADRLTPLDANEKAKYGLEDVATQLAFRYAAPPYTLNLTATRTVPRLTARTFAFFRVESDAIAAHYEIAYDVTEARTSRLTFELPGDTPAEVSIRALDGVAIKESTSETVDGLRRWTVQLAESRRGTVRLAVDYQQPLPAGHAGGAADTELKLPLVRARGVTYQSGLVAVEGAADRDVQVQTSLRKVDVGELAEADYQPGRRLLGAYFYSSNQAEVELHVARPAEYELPTAIVERAELITCIGASGRSQTAARFHLRAKALGVEVQLPAGSTLWGAFLDAQPTLPQREGDSLMIELPAGAAARLRNLQLVYETPIDPIGGVGSFDLPAPKLLLHGQGSTTSAVPLADLVWKLSTPLGLEVIRSSGTVFSDQVGVPQYPQPIIALSDTTKSLGRVLFGRDESVRSWVKSAPGERDKFDVEAKSEAKLADMDRTASEYPAKDEAEADDMSADLRLAPAAPAPAAEEPEAAMLEAGGSTAGDFRGVTGGELPPGMGGGMPLAGALGAGGGMGMGAPAKPTQWALEGLRSLPIELQADWPALSFDSLGEDPRLSVTLVDRSRLNFVGWSAALLVLLRGVWLTGRPWRQRVRYVIATLLIAYALPLLLPYSGLLTPVCDGVFYAAWALAIYYPLAALLRRIVSATGGGRHRTPQVATTALLVALLPVYASADEVKIPVTVPADAIIVPYDPAEHDPLAALNALLDPDNPAAEGKGLFPTDKSQKILVPYARYTELLRIVEGGGKPRPAPPVDYVLAGGRFEATLDGGESLLVDGFLDVDVLVEHAVSVPLPLAGGVLTSLRLEAAVKADAPADEKDRAAARGAAAKDLTAAQPPKPQPPEAPLAAVVSGLGRHRIALAMRFRTVSRGGWQIVEGQLPAPLAAALTLRVPKAGTEVVLTGGIDRGTIETKRDDQQIATALTADGRLHVEWRAKAGPAPVDQSLRASVAAVWDVQEGGLRLIWRVDLALRGTARDSFSLDVPADYLVEKVAGPNIRGWRLTKADAGQRLEVSLLKATTTSESFAVALSRRGAVGSGDLADLTAPVLSVVGAAQQSGQLTIRRSPLLQLRTEQTVGVARVDGNAPAVEKQFDAEESPLGILPYQFYRFAAIPFTVKLSARPALPHVAARLQTVLKISERQRTLESRIRLEIDERPIYRLRIAVPDDWKLDRVTAPQPFQWVIGQDNGRRVLNLYFAGGQRRSVDVVLAGPLGDYGPLASLPVPKLQVLSADEQEGKIEQTGHIVVTADPSLGVRAEKLVNCESELLASVGDWLAPAQQALARLALRYRTPDYSAELVLSPRKPVVHVTTLSNVRITQRNVEETILLDFTIQEAGIRSLSFLLPGKMADARISAPLLRQKTMTPVADDKAGRVRVRLDLQEEVIGNLRVLVEDDRLLAGSESSDKLAQADHNSYLAPIPEVETGQTDHRYVTLEAAGRDEIVVTNQEQVEAVSPEQAEWQTLSSMLGRGLTQAYQVQFGARDPQLGLRAEGRKAVETAGARIGLARAMLVLDEAGAFRGSQLYRVDNSLEQYLVVRLPEGAELWTAHVAGEPVKPAADSTPRNVRIPLVKTAPGDADYPVVLKYGGRLGRLGALRSLDLPLMQTVNIHVELSQVELYAPENYDWFDFGGTMRLVEDESYLAAGLLEYNTQQIRSAMQSLSSEDSYARARAANNLRGLQAESSRLKRSAGGYGSNAELSKQLQSNEQILRDAQGQLDQPIATEGEELDNRVRLGDLYRSQSNSRANDVVNKSGESFQPQSGAESAPAAQPQAPGQQFSAEWLRKNQLEAGKGEGRAEPARGAIRGEGGQQPMFKVVKPQLELPQNAPPAANQPAAPVLSDDKEQALPQAQTRVAKERESSGARAQRQLDRYSERLEQQSQAAHDRRDGDMPLGGKKPMGRPGPSTDSAATGLALLPTLEQVEMDDTLALAVGGQGLPAAALASLDVELNPRGKRFLFTTPRGDVEVTARALSASVLSRVLRLVGLAVLVALVYAVIARRRRYATSRMIPAQTHG